MKEPVLRPLLGIIMSITHGLYHVCVFSPIVRGEVVDLVRILHFLERIVYDICHFYVRVGDEGVEIYPPDPIPLPSLNQSFHHVELPICGSPIGMRFIVNNKMVAMAARVVCPWSMA